MFRRIRNYLLFLIIIFIPLSIIALIISYRKSSDAYNPENYPYKLTIQNSNQYLAIDSYDFDKDGYSEIFLAFDPHTYDIEKSKKIQVCSIDLKTFEQFNFEQLIRPPLSYADLNKDGRDEVLIGTNSLDTAFLEIRKIPDEKIDKFPVAWKDKFSNVEGEWRCSSKLLDFRDIDDDGLDELVFLVRTFYGNSPHGLYCIEYPGGKIEWVTKMGAAPPQSEVADLNGDTKPEYIIGTSTPENLKVEVNGTVDTLAYILIYDDQGNKIFEQQLGLKGTWVFPWISDIDRNGIQDCIVIENNYHKKAAMLNSMIYRFEYSIKKLIPVYEPIPRNILINIVGDFDLDGVTDLVIIDDKYRAMTFNFKSNGRWLTLKNQKDLKIKLWPQIIPLFHDLNLDGKKEIVLRGEHEIFVMNSNLEITAIFPNARDPFLVERGKERPLLLINRIEGGGCCTLLYQKNYNFILRKIKYLSIFFIFLIFIVGFFSLVWLMFRIISFPPFSRHERLWLEIDRKFRIHEMSPELRKLLGIRTIQLPKFADTLLQNQNADNLKKAFDNYCRGNPTGSITITLPTNEKRNFFIDIFKFPGSFFKTKYIMFFDDIDTSLSDKFMNWIIMIRAMVHDLKNPLTTAIMQLNNLKKQIAQKFNKKIQSECNFSDIEEELLLSKNATSEFLHFLDAWQHKSRPCDINEMIKSIVNDYQQKHDRLPQIKLSLNMDLPIIRVSHDLAKMAFENVIRNAIEATNPEEEIIISTSIEDKPAQRAKAIRQWINVEIMDTGSGIAEENLKNIFSSRSSSKPGGSGIGLVITKEIIDKFEGSINIESKEGLGTTVNMYIPVN